jgi:hypothetical protein
VQSASFKDVVREVLPFIKETNLITLFTTKLINLLISKRDYSV